MCRIVSTCYSFCAYRGFHVYICFYLCDICMVVSVSGRLFQSVAPHCTIVFLSDGVEFVGCFLLKTNRSIYLFLVVIVFIVNFDNELDEITMGLNNGENERLYTVPGSLGWLKRANTEGSINPQALYI